LIAGTISAQSTITILKKALMTEPCSEAAPKRLLLIAWNPNFRRTLARILCRCGYLVDGADSGEQALKHLECDSYDAVISEVLLPGNVCGLTVLERVHRAYPEMPIILLAERETTRLRMALSKCRTVSCLSLPVDVDHLKNLIASSTTKTQILAS
jgi:DNA-binding NtrC family response regulator